MIRRFGQPPFRNRKYTFRAGVYAILPRAGRLLLTLQEQPTQDLQLPGGGIDPQESPLMALHREVYEETGWKIAQARRLGAFRRFVFMPEYDIWAEKLCTVYMAQPVRPLGPPTEPFHRGVWVTPQKAAQALGNAGDRNFVSQWLR